MGGNDQGIILKAFDDVTLMSSSKPLDPALPSLVVVGATPWGMSRVTISRAPNLLSLN